MPEVKSVDNKLAVDSLLADGSRTARPVPTSGELASNVGKTLSRDFRIHDDRVDVVASGGQVRLYGSVPTLYEKDLAAEDAHNVVGVAWVSNYLSVSKPRPQDWSIATDVSYALRTDAALPSGNLHATSDRGVVTLTGTLHTWWQRTHARSVALHVSGVKEVVNRINVDRAPRYSDASIAQQIRDKLQWNAITYPVHSIIDVGVRNGVATLTGTVDSFAQRNEAASIAYRAGGVWLVDNRLAVKKVTYPWSEWYYKGDYHSTPPAEYDLSSKLR